MQGWLRLTFQLTALWNRWVLDTRSEFQQLGFGQISQLGDPAYAITVSFTLLAGDQPHSLWGLPHAREVPMKVTKLNKLHNNIHDLML